MLSVLIPTYRWNVYPLVKILLKQLQSTNCQFEIIVLDDGSKAVYSNDNYKINLLPNCIFEVLPQNIGRSSLRNLLAKRAIYPYLLFLDADVLPRNENFIEAYLSIIEKHAIVVGGIAYRQEEDSARLRWKIGKIYEEVSLSKRRQIPYKYFLTGNFMIHKRLFENISFEERIKGYGYEDLLFSKEIQKQNIPITHIANEVYHIGIDTNEVFMVKTKEALNNLGRLLYHNNEVVGEVGLVVTYTKLRKLKILVGMGLFSLFFEKQAIKTSSVLYYNLFRVTYLHKVLKQLD